MRLPLRSAALDRLRASRAIDVLIVGGGINGAGLLRELALNGIDALLVDKADFAAGATSASSRMIHGGLRYLENGEFRLVRESLRERNRLLNETLDLALYPFLFHGTSREQAAKGLWLARDAHLLAGDTDAAREVATDIIVLYPQTRHAAPAREALQKKPPES